MMQWSMTGFCFFQSERMVIPGGLLVVVSKVVDDEGDFNVNRFQQELKLHQKSETAVILVLGDVPERHQNRDAIAHSTTFTTFKHNSIHRQTHLRITH
jgi:hypothetical protein